MRRNKGFTLIELLAVIVVLAVIALIATPIVLSLVNKAKEGAAEASAYAYVKEVETYIMLTKLNPDLPKLENGKTYEVSKIKYEEVAFIDLFMDKVYADEINETIYLNDLIDMKGEKPTSGTVTINDNSVSDAKFTTKGYNVVCDEEICKVNGKSKVEKKELKIELGSVTLTYNSITIPYTVNEDADEDLEVKVYYGTTEALGQEAVCLNNKCEITGLSQKTKYYYKVVAKDTFGNVVSNESTITTLERELLCKRATKLHTEKCVNTSTVQNCRYAGYAANATITYGRLGDRGTLTSGDAFDCDVNNDNKFEERFYYVTDTAEGNAVMLYYSNVTSGVDDNSSTHSIPYNSSNQNWKGPVTAKKNLPTTTQWSNPKIIYPTTRAIVTETGSTTIIQKSGSSDPVSLPTAYSYSGYAARFLTTQEINKACKITVGSKKVGELVKNCLYMLERTQFSQLYNSEGYWLETPVTSSYLGRYVWIVDDDSVVDDPASRDVVQGVRPVIEVAKEDIEI